MVNIAKFLKETKDYSTNRIIICSEETASFHFGVNEPFLFFKV